MLFQPTSITPDYLGSIGNGIVDPALPFTASWMVNGNSAMTAFSIAIYENTAANTLIYDTGQLTDGCPFYGTDALGNKQFFIYTDESGDIMTALTGYTECKMVITQWWSATESVVQSSPSAFAIKEAPSLTLSVPSPIARRDYTFTANYSQADGDSLNWIRWWIAVNTAEGRENPIYDSGYIYGTALLECYYDGFLNDTAYCVKCEIETQSGITKATEWTSFMCSYTVGTLTGEVTAANAPCQRAAVKVEWSGTQYIYGVPSGDYTINKGNIELLTGSSVTWDEETGSAMSLEAPWNFIYMGGLRSKDATLFEIVHGSQIMRLVYTVSDRTLRFYMDGTAVLTRTAFDYTSIVFAVITPAKLYLGWIAAQNALYPATNLYPATTRYPKAGSQANATVTRNLSYTQKNVSSIKIYGAQVGKVVQVITGSIDESFIAQVISGRYEGDGTIDGTVFFCNFFGDLNAGSLYINGTKLSGWAVYRKKDTDAIAMHIFDGTLEQTAIYDYSACSQQGPYTYMVYPVGEDKYITTALVSNDITPTFWNWCIMECTYDEQNGYYELVREYLFGKNLSSGTISNNNSPNILDNFTQFPTVQLSPARYKSGTFRSLIGSVCMGVYSDTIDDREAIDALSTTQNVLFLKDRKGDLWEIRIAGEITYDTMDNTSQQAVTASIPWVQIADASEVSIIQIIEE